MLGGKMSYKFSGRSSNEKKLEKHWNVITRVIRTCLIEYVCAPDYHIKS